VLHNTWAFNLLFRAFCEKFYQNMVLKACPGGAVA